MPITEVPDEIRLELTIATAAAVLAELASPSILKDCKRQWADAERQAAYTMQHDPKRRLAIGLNVLTSAVEVMLTDCMRAQRAEPSQAVRSVWHTFYSVRKSNEIAGPRFSLDDALHVWRRYVGAEVAALLERAQHLGYEGTWAGLVEAHKLLSVQ